MTSFNKAEYWRPLFTNDESLDKTTNLYFLNTCAPYFAGDKAEFVLVKTIKYTLLFLSSQKHIKI